MELITWFKGLWLRELRADIGPLRTCIDFWRMSFFFWNVNYMQRFGHWSSWGRRRVEAERAERDVIAFALIVFKTLRMAILLNYDFLVLRGNFYSLLGVVKVHLGLCNCVVDSICIISEGTLVDRKILQH